MVFSQILGETIFFCEDEHTKTALVEAGADEWRIAPNRFDVFSKVTGQRRQSVDQFCARFTVPLRSSRATVQEFLHALRRTAQCD